MPTGNFIRHGFLKVLLLSQAIFLFSFHPAAQDSTGEKNKWSFLAEPYLMFPSLKGTIGVGTLPDAQLDADAGGVFSHLKMAAIVYFEMAKDKWAFSSDIIYMHLGEDVKTNALVNSGGVNFKQFSWEIGGLRKLLPWLEAGIGARYNSLKTDIALETKNLGGGTTARNRAISQTWVDPFLVARIKNSPGQKFLYQFRGDIAGGVGSEFAWQMQGYAGYRFSKLFQASAGYRIISVDYNSGSGDNRFLYDVDTFGPVIRLGFNF